MKKQKVDTKLGFAIIAIFTITIGVFVWRYEKKQPIPQESQMSEIKNSNNSKETSKIEISDKWTLVSHYNFWNNPNIFKQHPYNFPNIEFSYPENWEFRCCNDMEIAIHIIYSSKDRDQSLPFIRISVYPLAGCPNLKNDCSRDETIKLTANEKFNRLISAVSNDKVLPRLELKKLKTNAFVYNKTEKDNRTSKAYIINLGDDVIRVDFVNYDLLDDKFIKNFLNRIEFESK